MYMNENSSGSLTSAKECYRMLKTAKRNIRIVT